MGKYIRVVSFSEELIKAVLYGSGAIIKHIVREFK